MSKTDKTRPFWVREKDFIVVYPRTDEPRRWYSCWWVGELRCGCPMCTAQDWRREERRKERREGRRQARDWWREY